MKKSKKIRKSCSGFTVVELCVVIAIIAILGAIAVPGFAVWLPNHRLKSATSVLYSNMQLAKLEAVKHNANVVMWFDAANDNYRAFLDNGDGAGTAGDNVQNGSERTLIDITLEDDIDMYSTVFSVWSNQTVFNSRGFAEGGWGYVYIKNNQNKYMRITLWTNGFLQIESSTDGSTWSS
ncbi:MAG: GspH/FimT family pseudopilin [Deltaproteobacteria bacterium]|nr:GspH/FimT family pseudopilin [Deltaproteobacteria bacterium]